MDPKPSDRISKEEQVKVFRRALAAYFADPETTGWPDTEAVSFKRMGGLNYIRLLDQHSSGVLLACYRIRHDGKLKRLARPPEGME